MIMHGMNNKVCGKALHKTCGIEDSQEGKLMRSKQ
jgi:hypothetical protein